MNVASFRRIVWAHYKKFGRHNLPWRKTKNPYRILVSEVMLQQTQVNRVLPIYAEFIKHFPNAKTLAAAPLSEVLKSWQGLGYNRRAKMIHQAAKELAVKNIARSDLAKLEKLPGVGPYTARAVAAFAYNEGVIFIETNIRTAVIHHFFSNYGHRKSIDDAEISEILQKALPKGKAREWYSALMDYGAHLKQSGISHNERSNKYMKQTKFAGSNREARGAILRELTFSRGPTSRKSEDNLINLLGLSRSAQLRAALTALQSEGLIEKTGRNYSLAK